MCGIAGAFSLKQEKLPQLQHTLVAMNQIQAHRGPDGYASWLHEQGHIGFAHRRLSIIDLETGDQPMCDPQKNWITYNGEIYNYLELARELGRENFITSSDTEVILHAYEKWDSECVNRFRGMFAFALWDEKKRTLFCARDRFGIKPFYYTIVDGVFYFASEAKALLPFLPTIETDPEGLLDYLTFQFCLHGKTLFKNIHELQPGHTLTVKNGVVNVQRYWEVYYDLDFEHTDKFFTERLRALVSESVKYHLRSDVPVGSYLSGGLDSSIVTSLASSYSKDPFLSFTGKFQMGRDYDESYYARELANNVNTELIEIDITADDFLNNIRKTIYHLDYPVAGPGAFPQFMVSKAASEHRKVVLGGQGGDEIFGGYARYLIAYFEQVIKAAIDGTIQNGNFIVTYESILPNLGALRNYKPLMQYFWEDGLFGDMEERYFRIINRGPTLASNIKWQDQLDYSPFESFKSIFNGNNVGKESYFDKMTHFDFKSLLPALLQVEDRMSMAHGLESRVPLLDHPLVEFAATIPSNVKFMNGEMKRVLKEAHRQVIPPTIANRQDKMGFPTPISEWAQGPAREFLVDVFSSNKAKSRDMFDYSNLLQQLEGESKYGRELWGLLSLELWQQEFHDRTSHYQKLVK
ncbi:MAG: asparagine synthase (glutamine-hydrolyzing) [Chloroflexi bacterium]|nr:MAG: asparagine synthase (glutamine-hydrolyzing) [Chloroflexota bacterium]MBL1193120.1 asparagine synthase (glutamine-hydrolyzing) [Chloroflexota bacterium]NOH10413.1 asparagine synthase (glutamine-hydrolyzing) [Chloroflexota bacterium]